MYQQFVRPIIAVCLMAGTFISSVSGKSIVLPDTIRAHSMVNPADTDIYFKLQVKIGDKIGNIFSIANSFKGEGFDEVVRRNSGTCIYTVLDNNPDKPVFEATGRYDGQPEGTGKFTNSNKGRTNSNDKGQSSDNTDASGILYNSLMWGAPPATLQPGVSWNVTMAVPWELGGPGVQKVTVIATDPANHTITLQREGNSTGFFDNDAKQIHIVKDGKTILVDMIPGDSHWTGYTIIKNGLIVSDELMVTRPVTLVSGDTKFSANQRRYMLLNQMPVTN